MKKFLALMTLSLMFTAGAQAAQVCTVALYDDNVISTDAVIKSLFVKVPAAFPAKVIGGVFIDADVEAEIKGYSLVNTQGVSDGYSMNYKNELDGNMTIEILKYGEVLLRDSTSSADVGLSVGVYKKTADGKAYLRQCMMQFFN